MTTLLVSEIFPPKIGGSGRWFWELYSRLPGDAYAVAAGTDPRQDEVREIDATARLAIERVPLSFPTRFLRPSSLGHYWRAYSQLVDVVRARNVDWLHAARCLPEGLLSAAVSRRCGIRYACFAHGEEVNLSNPEPRPPRDERRVYESRELARMVGWVLDRSAYVIANSDNTARILTDRWELPAERVHRVHPGVDTDRFTPAQPSAEIRERLAWTGRKVLLTVGRLQRRKGHDVLIEAIPEIRRRVPEVLYAIVGDGEERSALEQRARSLGVESAVHFLGEVDDEELVDCYRQCDLFVLPNREIAGDIEGFGLVLLEAQACGRPVVAGDSGGTAETMSPGETGLLFRCDRPEELAGPLAELLGDAARLAAMGGAARRWIEERFGWDASARRAAEVFAQWR
jgi:phosphatidylinositol alpha-1,6-mannosyltransferase